MRVKKNMEDTRLYNQSRYFMLRLKMKNLGNPTASAQTRIYLCLYNRGLGTISSEKVNYDKTNTGLSPFIARNDQSMLATKLSI